MFSEKRGKYRRQSGGQIANMSVLTRSLDNRPQDSSLTLSLHLSSNHHFLSVHYILKFMKTFIKPVCSKSGEVEVHS